MQQFVLKYSLKIAGIFIFLLTCMTGLAQDKIEINKEEIGSWFERNWIWVAGALVLILLIAAFSRSRNRGRITNAGGTRSTTTVVKDAAGNTQSVTTTEENI